MPKKLLRDVIPDIASRHIWNEYYSKGHELNESYQCVKCGGYVIDFSEGFCIPECEAEQSVNNISKLASERNATCETKDYGLKKSDDVEFLHKLIKVYDGGRGLIDAIKMISELRQNDKNKVDELINKLEKIKRLLNYPDELRD